MRHILLLVTWVLLTLGLVACGSGGSTTPATYVGKTFKGTEAWAGANVSVTFVRDDGVSYEVIYNGQTIDSRWDSALTQVSADLHYMAIKKGSDTNSINFDNCQTTNTGPAFCMGRELFM